MTPARTGSRTAHVAQHWVEVVVAILALVPLVWSLWWSDRELDVVDESFVLLLIAHPRDAVVGGEVFFFGAIYHPLLELVGNDVASLRRLSLLATALLLALAVVATMQVLWHRGQGVPPGGGFRQGGWLLPSVGSGAAVLVVAFGYVSPGYLSLTVQGLLAAYIGLVGIAHRGWTEWGGYVLLGIGGWLVFAAKPPAALALAIITGLALLALGKVRWLGVILGVAVASVSALLTWHSMGLSPIEAVAYLERGVKHVELVGNHSALRVLGFGPGAIPTERFLIIGVAIVIPVCIAAVAVARTSGDVSPWLVLAGCAAALIGTCVFCILILESIAFHSFGHRGMAVMLLMPLPWLAWLATRLRSRPRVGPHDQEQSRIRVVLATFAFVSPWIYAVGSDVPLGVQMPRAAAFYLLAATAILAGARRPERELRLMRLITGTTAVALVWVVWSAGVLRPGGNGPLAEANTGVNVLGGQLKIGPEQAEELAKVRSIAQQNGVTHDTPMIDLTGNSAGYAMQLGGRPLGRAQLFGTTPGGVRAARYSLNLESCSDRALAWLLYAPTSPWDVSAALEGVDPNRDYTDRGTVNSRYGYEIHVLEPKPSLASKMACDS